MSMSPERWRERGAIRRINGRSIFYVDTGGDKEVLVVLHGYPTSSHDYHRVLPALAERFRVIVHDHVGFGHSDKPLDYSYALMDQADVAEQLWLSLGVNRAHCFAHDYGTSVATELVARTNQGHAKVTLASVTLCNGSVHIELARLRLIQKLLRNTLIGPLVARLSSKRVFTGNMRALWADPTLLSDEDLDAMWTLLTRDGGKKVLAPITRYLRDRVTHWDRWVGGLRQTKVPLSFLWGEADPITGRAVAEVHHKESAGSHLALLDGVGHYPMLEAPDRWVEALLRLVEQMRAPATSQP